MTDHSDLDALLNESQLAPEQIHSRTRQSFAALSTRLTLSGTSRWTRFFNMGYRDLPAAAEAQRSSTLPRTPRGFNTDAARLVAELVDDVPLDGNRVLDVGCGRGGSLGLIARHCRTTLLVGVDLSSDNAEVARRSAHVAQADAEMLPLASGSFDVVLNLESSQFYPNPVNFYLEVRRLLAVGGAFLYGDCFVSSQFAAVCEVLRQCGFTLESDRDVSPNVIASRLAVGDRHSAAVGGDAAGEVFVGAPTSTTFLWLKGGQFTYRLLRLTATGSGDPRRARRLAGEAGIGSAASALAHLTDDWAK